MKRTWLAVIVLSLYSLVLPELLPAEARDLISLPERSLPHPERLLFPRYRVCAPRVALVLSGGGARGIAHIGVLEVLEKNRIPIDLIVGVSMGSIIGGLYAAGYQPRQILQLTQKIRWNEIIQDQPKRTSLFLSQKEVKNRAFIQFRLRGLEPIIPTAVSPGQKLYSYLLTFVLNAPFSAAPTFDDLKIPFRAVATDISRGRKCVFSRGDLAQIMLGSSAIPLLFSPVPVDSFLLMDGGILDNIPVDVARRFSPPPDLVIAVDATSPLRSTDKELLPWQLADQVTTIMQKEQKERSLKLADVVITPDLGSRTNTNFDSLETIYRAGVAAAQRALPVLRQRLQEKSCRESGAHKKTFFISALKGTDGIPARLLQPMNSPRRKLTRRAILRFLSALYRRGTWDSLSVELIPRPDSTYALVLHKIPFPVLKKIQFTGNHVLPDSLLRQEIRLRAGERFNIFQWQEERERILRCYRRNDLPLARILREELNRATGTLTVEIDEGTVRSVELIGNKRTRDLVILREFPIRPGQVFRFSALEKGLNNIYSLDLFERIQPEFVWQKKGLSVRLRLFEKPFTLVKLRYHYSRDYLLQTQVQWIHNNLMGMGNRLIFSGILGRRRSLAQISFQSDRVFRSYFSTNLNAYSSVRDYLAFSGGKEIGAFREQRTGLELSAGEQLHRIGLVNFVLISEDVRFFRLYGYGYSELHEHKTSFKLQSIVDSLDKLPFPFSGRFQYFYYEMASSLLGNRRPFFKIYSLLESYFTFRKRWTLHPKIVWAVADMTTPFTEMFTLGGQNSFYGLREAELRGRRVFAASLQLRYFLPARLPISTYFSLRYDWGSVWQNSKSNIQLKDFFSGYGGSVSLETLLGVFSFGYGKNSLDRKEYYLDLGFRF